MLGRASSSSVFRLRLRCRASWTTPQAIGLGVRRFKETSTLGDTNSRQSGRLIVNKFEKSTAHPMTTIVDWVGGGHQGILDRVRFGLRSMQAKLVGNESNSTKKFTVTRCIPFSSPLRSCEIWRVPEFLKSKSGSGRAVEAGLGSLTTDRPSRRSGAGHPFGIYCHAWSFGKLGHGPRVTSPGGETGSGSNLA